jgi:hypothetical protein
VCTAPERPAAGQALAHAGRRAPGQVDDRERLAEQLPGLVEVPAARDLLQRDHVGAQVGQQAPDHRVALRPGRVRVRQQVEGQDAHGVAHRHTIPHIGCGPVGYNGRHGCGSR